MGRPKKYSKKDEVRILMLLHEGNSQSQISRTTDIDDSAISRIIAEFVKKGYIEDVVHKTPKLYVLREAGLDFIETCMDPYPDKSMKSYTKIWNIHSIRYTAKLHELPDDLIGWDRIAIVNRHVKNRYKYLKDCTIQNNNFKSITFIIKPIITDNPADALLLSINIARKYYDVLEKNFGFRMGDIRFKNKSITEMTPEDMKKMKIGHFETYDPIVEKILRKKGQINLERGGMDASKSPGDLRLESVDEGEKYLELLDLPDRISKLENRIINNQENIESLSKAYEKNVELLERLTSSLENIEKVLKPKDEKPPPDQEPPPPDDLTYFG